MIALDNPPNAAWGGIVITCLKCNHNPVRLKHRLPRHLA